MGRSGLYDYGKSVDLPVQRRLFSLLAGRHQGERSGSSHEFLDMAEYKLGDDISDVDWKATARHNQPIIKRFESTAALNVYLVVDGGSNMAALAGGGAGLTKNAVVEEFCTAISWLTARRGDHLGLVVGNSEKTRFLPARSGISHAEMVQRTATSIEVGDPDPDVPGLVRRLEAGLNRKSLVLLVTDYLQVTPQLWRPLRRLLTRHQVAMMLVEDFDPTRADLKSTVSDVKYGILPDFVRQNSAIRQEWALARQAERSRAEMLLTQMRVPFASAGAAAGVLPALIQMFEQGANRG